MKNKCPLSIAEVIKIQAGGNGTDALGGTSHRRRRLHLRLVLPEARDHPRPGGPHGQGALHRRP